MKSADAIAFEYRPSRWLSFAAIAVAGLAFIAIAVCGLHVWLKLGLAAAVAIHAAYSLRAFLRPPFAGVAWHAAGHWRLRDPAGHEHVGELVRSVVLGPLIVLVLRRDARRTCAFILLPDNCTNDIRRRLRVRLARADAVEKSRE
jgi:toxin CptA